MNWRQKIYISYLKKRTDWHEKHRLPGGNQRKDETIYIIRRSGMKLGLFSYIETNLAQIDYALKHGMIPVVDMQHFDNSLKTGDDNNPWDDFFEQPGGLSLEDAYKSKHIILSDSGIPEKRPSDDASFLYGNDDRLKYWQQVFRESIKLKTDIAEHIMQRYQELFDGEDKVLGVLARGTDYIKQKPANHPIQPEPDEILEKVCLEYHNQGYSKVFLATEDKRIANLFKDRLGEKCVTNDVEYIDYEDGYLANAKNAAQIIRKNKNLDYLTNIVLLTKCDGIIAGRTSGTVGAVLMSEGWKYSFFIDEGVY